MDPVHWFLPARDDVRSSYYLEDVATEFHVQGLEVDWACVTWDADFRHTHVGWEHWSFVGNRWNAIRKAERKTYLKNAYRVLLTRARQGMVIVVPPGDSDDPTRKPEYYDSTFAYLKEVGFQVIQVGCLRGCPEMRPTSSEYPRGRSLQRNCEFLRSKRTRLILSRRQDARRRTRREERDSSFFTGGHAAMTEKKIRGLSTSRTSLGMTQTGRQRRNLELALKNRAVKGPAPSSSPWQGEEKDGGAGILRFALE